MALSTLVSWFQKTINIKFVLFQKLLRNHKHSFVLLFKDLIRLFGYYNDGIIYLLQKFFEMKKQQCKDGLEIYKKYLVRMEKIQSFLKVAENVSQSHFNTAAQYMVSRAPLVISHSWCSIFRDFFV